MFMIQIETLVFNDFQVNTYVLHDETGACIIIDPGCSNEAEQKKLEGFLENNNLTPVGFYNTHLHIDHLFGNDFVKNRYKLQFLIHPDGIHFLNTAIGFSSVFGYNLERIPANDGFMQEGDKIRFGNSELDVIETPGHAAGSFCFVCKPQKFVIVGDVLFSGSIGRTDLPSGDMDVLLNSIRKKLFTLGDNYRVYCGHGPVTTIGEERMFNPFLT
jgi:hydroxyacylglutathione hydrolase